MHQAVYLRTIPARKPRYSRAVLRLATFGPLLAGLATVVLSSPDSWAQELGDDLLDARNIGRAGASTVSGDSGVQIVRNPAGMVRRAQSRLLLSVGIEDSDLEYASNNASSPTLTNRAAPTTLPTIAYHHGVFDGRFVLGVLLRSGSSHTSLPTPAFGQPPADVDRLFPHRYGGTAYKSTWRQLALGGAIRLGDSWGVGASLGLRDVEVREDRRIWAGFAGRDPVLGAERDLALSIVGRDRVNPSATLGVLYAPIRLPLEFATSAELQAGANLSSSEASLRPTNSSEFPAVSVTTPTAETSQADRATVRGGIRYLGERLFVEGGIDMALVRNNDDYWTLSGIDILDESTVVASLGNIPTLHSERSRMTVRGAVDYEALAGFLWVTAGYSWHAPSTSEYARMPAYSKLGGHRLALGMLASHEDYSLSVGYSRRLARTRSIGDRDSVATINPFNAGSGPSNAGSYTSSSDQFGFALEVAW